MSDVIAKGEVEKVRERTARPWLSPLNQRRWQNFKANRRGYWSLWIFLVLFVLSLFAEFIANDKPIVASYKGEILFPVLVDYPEEKFGGFLAVTDYRDPIISEEIEANGWLIWPPIRYSYRTVNNDIPESAPAKPSWLYDAETRCGRYFDGADQFPRDVVELIQWSEPAADNQPQARRRRAARAGSAAARGDGRGGGGHGAGGGDGDGGGGHARGGADVHQTVEAELVVEDHRYFFGALFYQIFDCFSDSIYALRIRVRLGVGLAQSSS